MKPREPSRREKAIATAFDKGLALHRKGQLARAELYYKQALSLKPDHFDALHLLGVVEGQNGNFDEALALLQRAVELRPDSPAALANLGNTLGSMKRHEQAVEAFDRSLALRPDDAKALRNRGTSLRGLKRLAEALADFDRANALNPSYAEAVISRAETLQDLGRLDEAIEAFRAALEFDKDTDLILYALAALGAEPVPAAAPAQYVAGLFDGYADNFDSHLVGTLNYRTPQLLLEALQRIAPVSGDVVDLGCGTGLCAPLLKPPARRLVGVDLSGGMLAKARDSGLYDALEKAEIAAFLGQHPGAFDLAVAADVFVYIGDLAPVFAAAATALRPGGRLAFSVEAAEPAASAAGADWVLHDTRRYAHARGYIERLAAAHGFAVEALEGAVIRQNGERDVDGWLAVLRRG